MTTPILDDNGNIIKSCYVAKTTMYGTKLFSTLEGAKEFVKYEILPRVLYMFWDSKDARYYSFTAYSIIDL
jgi:hypothetical protein